MLSFLQVSTQLYVHAAGNPLLNYLKGLEAECVKSLTIVSEDGIEAINSFIHRLLGEHSVFQHAQLLSEVVAGRQHEKQLCRLLWLLFS